MNFGQPHDLAWFLHLLITEVLQPLGTIFVALAVVFLLWNVFQIIMRGEDAEERSKLKTQVFWSIIAIAVMVSLWGLVTILTNTFGLSFIIPQLNTDPSAGQSFELVR